MTTFLRNIFATSTTLFRVVDCFFTKPKTVIVFFSLFLTVTNIFSQCEQRRIHYAEINYEQDTINPLKFYFIYKAVFPMFCNFNDDKANIVWNKTSSDYLDLSDTIVFDDPFYPLKTYYGSHVFDSIPSDSIVNITVDSYPMTNSVSNSFDPPSESNLACQAVINFKHMKNKLGVKSPKLTSTPLQYIQYNKPFQYYPKIVYDTNFTIYASLVLPYSTGDVHNAGITPLGMWPTSTNNNFSINTTNGNFYWDKPLSTGNPLITYEVAFFDKGAYLGNITRNMVLRIVDSTTTSIENTNNTSTISIYPNPTTQTFFIKTQEQPTSNLKVKIASLTGQSVLSREITNPTFLEQITTTNLSPGIYLISVAFNQKVSHLKLVIE